MTIRKKSQVIRTLDEWKTHAGPKSEEHWQDDPSAKEAARCWLGVTSPALPGEIEGLLAAHPAFGAVADWHAEPEARLAFDAFVGERRNTDLLVYARDAHGDYLIAVEAKADESFGSSVSSTIAAAVKRKGGDPRRGKPGNPRSKGEERVKDLVVGLLAADVDAPGIGTLRYQLLTATAGALAAGRSLHAGRVVLLVQEFVTRRTDDDKHEANGRDLDRFVQRLSGGSIASVEAGTLYGPIAVRGALLFAAPCPQLYVAKVTRNIRP